MDGFIEKIRGYKFIITAVVGIITYLLRFVLGDLTIGETTLPAVSMGELADFIYLTVLAIFAKLKLNRSLPDKE